MKFQDDGGDEGCEPNMTPMIDCVFLLLIFFLVATVVKKTEKEVEVNLPDAVHAVDTKYAEDKRLVIGIMANGDVCLDGEPVGIEKLHAKLRDVARNAPQTHIRIDGDQQAPFQSVTHVLDLCAFEGLKVAGIHTAGDPRKSSVAPKPKPQPGK